MTEHHQDPVELKPFMMVVEVERYVLYTVYECED